MERDIEAERQAIDRVVEGRTLCQAFAETAAQLADREALRSRDGEAGWEALTWEGYRKRVREVALGVRAMGIPHRAFGVILARNVPEHLIADMGLVHAGCIPVSLYNTLAREQIAYIVNHCDASVAFVEGEGALERFLEMRSEMPGLQRVVAIGSPEVSGEGDGWVVSWEDLLASGRAEAARDPGAFESMWHEVTPDDPATLIYTSGTTGEPKGVIITHRNVFWTSASFAGVSEATPEERVISYLPLAHVAERFTSHWQALIHGGTVTFCPDMMQLRDYLVEVRPTYFVGVPRVWEKLRAGILAALAEQDPDIRALVEDAIETSLQVLRHQVRAESVPDELAARREAAEPILAAVRERIGLDCCKVPVTGAAPIAADVLQFFHALGLRVCDSWGMSELTGPATFVRPDRPHIGTAGPTMPGLEARLAPDGELWIRGGSVMAGYYRDPERTAEVLDGDGWLRTGDLAEITPEGLRITGRKKELIVTAGGKNISPLALEERLKAHPLVGQACVIGDGRRYLVALLVLDPEAASEWARANGSPARTVAELAVQEALQAEVEQAVEQANASVSRAEQIKRFTLLPVDWTPETGELTPTLKLRRRVIEERYAEIIEAMYEPEPFSIRAGDVREHQHPLGAREDV